MSYHSIQVVGRLTRDPERQVESAPVKFGVAANTRRKVEGNWEEKTVYFTVAAFGHTATFAESYLHKGDLVLVTGELNFDLATGNPRTWIRKDGNPGSSYEINASQIKKLSWAGRDNVDAGDLDDVSLNDAGAYSPARVDDDIPF